jgi:TfoX/Sxy family transcriptional regulator of competence genes
MPHDPLFEQRIAEVLLAEGIKAEPRKMFGGVAFMVNGHMSVGITSRNEFMVRVDPTRNDEFLGLAGARSMDMTGKRMKGFLLVDKEAVDDDEELREWIRISMAHVKTLPPKEEKRGDDGGRPTGAKAAPKRGKKGGVR